MVDHQSHEKVLVHRGRFYAIRRHAGWTVNPEWGHVRNYAEDPDGVWKLRPQTVCAHAHADSGIKGRLTFVTWVKSTLIAPRSRVQPSLRFGRAGSLPASPDPAPRGPCSGPGPRAPALRSGATRDPFLSSAARSALTMLADPRLRWPSEGFRRYGGMSRRILSRQLCLARCPLRKAPYPSSLEGLRSLTLDRDS